MNAVELLEHYERGRKDHGGKGGLFHGGDKLEPAGLALSSERCEAPGAVRRALEAFAPAEGWLCFQSAVLPFRRGEPLPDAGTILYGEVCRADGASLHLRQAAGGGWRLTAYRPVAEGTEYLTEEVTRLVEPAKGGGELRYRRYWGRPESTAEAWHGGPPEGDAADEIPGDGWLPLFAPFIGFAPQQEQRS